LLEGKYDYHTVHPGTRDYDEYCALRHEVFCEELQRVPHTGETLGGLSVETDDFDVQSLHVLCRSVETGEAMGCARLILPGALGLNVRSRYQLAIEPNESHQRIGEIGRLALASKLRRSRQDCFRKNDDFSANEVTGSEQAIKRHGSVVALGLYREIFRLARIYGITHCYAAMEPSLARLLNRLSFPFHEAGPLNHAVQPARQPYVISAAALRSRLATHNLWLHRFMYGAENAPSATTSFASPWSQARCSPQSAAITPLNF